MIGLIVVVVVLIASIALAILASKVWHWAHVLVVVGLVFSTVGFSNLGYRVLSVRAKYQKTETDALASLEEVESRIEAINRGTENGGMVARLAEPLGLDENAEEIKSIGDLEHQLRMVNRVRGRLWDNVRPLGAPDQQSFTVNVAVSDDAPPLNITQGAILYAFEQGDPSQGAAYIGEFRVVQASPRQLRLEPVLQMHPDDLDRYFDSAADGRPWTLHESMPVDTHKMFAGMSEQQLRAILPEGSVEEYLRHGGPVQPDDPPRRVMGIDQDGNLVGPESIDSAQQKIYYRELRDYAFEFQEQAKRQRELRSEGLSLQSNLQQTLAALEGAKKLGEFRQEEQRKLKHDLAGVQRDLKAITDHLAAVEGQVNRAKDLLTQTLAANLRTAQQLSALQAALAGSPDLNTNPTGSSAAGDQHAL
ncbi:hypothetical protein Pla123a_02340 [Posidoniimonas polymericola]|uniref:Uncharacterized protein n=1 Tax=Posidoniimonas polymericola TaxID=2528002 RepID=A0A5C5ZEE3_9BACT|nr:hypothetical protein [Posidoniimonas polymericola]TWT85427.1 hypothetical protein Pla123a_02340 [Posidoniimonas polymericola]